MLLSTLFTIFSDSWCHAPYGYSPGIIHHMDDRIHGPYRYRADILLSFRSVRRPRRSIWARGPRLWKICEQPKSTQDKTPSHISTISPWRLHTFTPLLTSWCSHRKNKHIYTPIRQWTGYTPCFTHTSNQIITKKRSLMKICEVRLTTNMIISGNPMW